MLQAVQGFHIEFHRLQFSHAQWKLIQEEISDLMWKGAVVRSTLHPGGFLSNLFLVEKQDRCFRPVINLQDFNEWQMYHHFKMEGVHPLRDLLPPGTGWYALI